MQPARFDPFRTEHRLLWSNRVRRWRERPGESVFHAAALLLLGSLLLLPLLQDGLPAAPTLQAALQRWPLTIASVALILMSMQQARQLATLRERARREWLAALPIDAALHARRRHDRLLARGALQLAVGMTLLHLAGGDWRALLALLLCVLLAACVALPLSELIFDRPRARHSLISRVRDAGVGRLWRWQRIACGVALRGPRLALGAWVLLLVPMGSGPLVVLAIAIAGLVLVSLATAWQRSLAVLPQAQAWLAAQPVDGAWLLPRSGGIPAVVACLGAALCGALLAVLGTPLLAAFAVSMLLAIAGLHYACTAAERARPRRIGLLLTLHLLVLMTVLQTMPMAALLVWPLQMLQLLRRGWRR